MTQYRLASDTGTTVIYGSSGVRRNRKRTPWIAVTAVVCLVAVGAIWGVTRPVNTDTDTPLRPNAIAILPFTVSGDPALEGMDDGVVEMLYNSINGAGDLIIIDHNALLGYVDRTGYQIIDRITGREVADYYAAACYVLGSIRNVGGPIRISASLYDENDEVQATAQVDIEVVSDLVQ